MTLRCNIKAALVFPNKGRSTQLKGHGNAMLAKISIGVALFL